MPYVSIAFRATAQMKHSPNRFKKNKEIYNMLNMNL